MLVAQDVLHSLCFLLVSLLQFFLAFGSGSLHRLQGLQKNKKHPGRTHKTTKGTQQCLGAGLSSEDCFWGGLCFWIRKPSSATRTAKTNRHLRKAPKTNQMILRMFGRRTFFRGFGFCVCCMFLLFLDPEAFISYWDCKKNRSTSGNNKNFKKTKTPKDFQECLGPGFSFFRAFDFFWCFSFSFYSTFFLVFGFGSFHPLLGLQKTRNPSGKQKNQRIQRNVWAQDFLQRLRFLFLILVAAPTAQKTNVFSFSLYRFVHVSCRRRPRI